MIGLSHEAYVEEWYKRYCKGKVQSVVARGEEPVLNVVKTLETILRKGRVSRLVLHGILQQVENESVRPFANWPDYGARLDRLKQIKNSLGF